MEAVLGELLSGFATKGVRPFVVTVDSASTFRLDRIVNEYSFTHIDVGVRESTAMALAAGLSSHAPTLVLAFAAFGLRRGLESLTVFERDLEEGQLILLGALPGLSAANDGMSHHSLDDFALLSSLSRVAKFVPSDAASARWVGARVLETNGLSFVRAYRTACLPEEGFSIEGVDGLRLLKREGNNVAIIGYGPPIRRAAVEVSGFDVFEICRLDLLSPEVLSRLESYTHVVVLEEHGRYGGLFNFLAVKFGSQINVAFAGVEEDPGSGAYAALLETAGLAGATLRRRIRGLSS